LCAGRSKPVPCGMTRWALTASLAAALAAGGCARPPAQRASEMLRAQLDADWAYWMSEYPETATALGYPGHNASWTDYSPSAIERRAAYLRNSFDRLAAVDRAQFGADEQLNYDLYR